MRTNHSETTVVVRDNNTTNTVTTTLDSVADMIRPWFQDAPAEVVEMIDNLQANIDANRDYDGELAGLDITIEYVED